LCSPGIRERCHVWTPAKARIVAERMFATAE
jgi:hypothetical protein